MIRGVYQKYCKVKTNYKTVFEFGFDIILCAIRIGKRLEEDTIIASNNAIVIFSLAVFMQ